MTQNQLQWMRNQEDLRTHQAQEAETKRHNWAQERFEGARVGETVRHNKREEEMTAKRVKAQNFRDIVTGIKEIIVTPSEIGRNKSQTISNTIGSIGQAAKIGATAAGMLPIV